jgi:hypothetical protein
MLKFRVSAAHAVFCSGFDSRQLHREDAGQGRKPWPVSFPSTSEGSIDAPTPLMHKEIQRGQKSVDDEFRPIQGALAERRCIATASAIDVAICSSGPRKPIRWTGDIARSPATLTIQLPESGDDWYDHRSPPRRAAVVGMARNVIVAGEGVCSPPGVGVPQRGAHHNLLGRDSPSAEEELWPRRHRR